MAISNNIESLIAQIESDLEFREKFRKALGIDDEYARKSDLVPILDSINKNLEEIKNLRTEMRENLTQIWDEIKNLRNEMKVQREEITKVWEEIKNLREETKALKEEMKVQNDNIVKIWEEIKNLREETKALNEEIKKQREESERNFAKVWEEIKKLREETNALREDMKISLERMWKEIESTKKAFNRRFDKHEDWLKKLGIVPLEMRSFRWLRALLDAKGENIDNLRWRVKFKDPKARLGTEDIEIDIFSDSPLYMVEVTNRIDDIKKITKFKKKVEFITEKFGKKPKAIIITEDFAEDIEEEVMDICRVNDIEVLDVGWKPDK